jgi:prevent-host-death family protein
MSTKVNVHEAKTHFSKLLARVEKGEEITICKTGKPVARMNPIEKRLAKRVPGGARGKVIIAEDFAAPVQLSRIIVEEDQYETSKRRALARLKKGFHL